ncbi:MAG: hemolysin III family protein [Anaerolineales bacterium]|nr:hemolysin III family protein [Anaerolineales bacterium]
MQRWITVLKEPVSGLTHFASAVLALIGLVVLFVASPPNWLARAALLAYGLSLVLLFAASSTYHLVKTTPDRELLLRKLDHTAIFLLIAGTYTPVCAIVLNGAWRWGLLAVIWTLAAAGIAFKLAFIRSPRWLSVLIYLAMGWLGVIGLQPLFQALPLAGIGWLLAGGLLYTAGALVYATKRLDFFPGVFGFHEVWHLFVSAASAAHFVFVLAYVAPAGLR